MVVRADVNGCLVNARPCYQCTLMMKDLKIHKVYYSIDNMIVCEKIADMISINRSYHTKHVDIVQNCAPTSFIKYYQHVMDKMPHHTKRRNVDHFIRSVKNEIENCNCNIIGDKLIINVQNQIIGEILIN